TAPVEPQVQPSCLTPSGPSGRGWGQFATTSYGPNSSWPPISWGAAVLAADVVAAGLFAGAQPVRAADASTTIPDEIMSDKVRARIVSLLSPSLARSEARSPEPEAVPALPALPAARADQFAAPPAP